MFKKFLKDESGTTAIEYTLIATLIGVAVISGISAIGADSTLTLQNVGAYF